MSVVEDQLTEETVGIGYQSNGNQQHDASGFRTEASLMGLLSIHTVPSSLSRCQNTLQVNHVARENMISSSLRLSKPFELSFSSYGQVHPGKIHENCQGAKLPE